MKRLLALVSAMLLGTALLPAGCGGDDDGDGDGNPDDGRPDETGAVCAAPVDCYPGVDTATIQGEVLCLDELRDGYCTHTCAADTDCCAAAGECKTDLKQVCSPFESTGNNMCFLSCEPEDLVPAPGQTDVNDQEYCQRAAGRDFICRSSGGGSSNRKICVPGDCGVGAACLSGADCATGLECVTSLGIGYCTKRSCTANAECPTGSACVRHTDGQNYCMKSCAGASDCTFCRGYNDLVACTPQVQFVETGFTGSVCVPD